MNTVPINFLYNSADIESRVDSLLEAVGYKVREIDELNLESEKITQYHFLMGIYTDLKVLDEQLQSYFRKVEKSNMC